MATLTTGTVNFGEDVFWNPRPLVRDIAKRIRALGIKPEIECFDVGMIDEAECAREGGAGRPARRTSTSCSACRARSRRGARGAGLHDRVAARGRAPGRWRGWGGTSCRSSSWRRERGGNARVGLEDNIYVSKGVLAKGNWELVAEAAKRAKAKGRTLATPQQARELLRLT